MIIIESVLKGVFIKSPTQSVNSFLLLVSVLLQVKVNRLPDRS